MKDTLRSYEKAITNLKNKVTTVVRDINFKLIEDNPLIVNYHTSTNTIETIEVESISKDGLIVGNCGTTINSSDLTNESVTYVFNYYHDLINALDDKKLIKFGIFIGNDSNGDIEIQKVDDVDSLELDFTPIKLKSDTDAVIIAMNLDKLQCDRVLSVSEYVEKLGFTLGNFDENSTIEDVQNYADDECDLSLFDYPICEIDMIFEDVNENLVLVYDKSIDDIRLCEV